MERKNSIPELNGLREDLVDQLASEAMSKFDQFYQSIESPNPYLRALELTSSKKMPNTVIRLLKKLNHVEEDLDDWNRAPIEIYLDTGNEYFGGMTRYTINESSSIEKIHFDVIKGVLKLSEDQIKHVGDGEIDNLITALDSAKPLKSI